MRERLELYGGCSKQMARIWITIDDNESHYFKVLCDEVFGRANFVAQMCLGEAYTPKKSPSIFQHDHDYVLCRTQRASSRNAATESDRD